MNFESPKIEKRDEKSEFRKTLEKELRKVAAWGFITISGFGIAKALIPEKLKEGVSLNKIMSVHIDKDKKIKSNEKQELHKKIDYLKEQFGELILLKLHYFSEADTDLTPKEPEINGFDKLHSNLDNNILKKIWSEKYYPKGWINERVKTVEYIEEEALPQKKYGLDSRRWETIAQYNSPNTEKAKILFFRPKGSLAKDTSAQQVALALDYYFSHELGHANDWIEEDMDFKNRVEFLYDVAKQCFSEGALSTDYVVSIKNKDLQQEKYFKASEYWAEMCAVYFLMPNGFDDKYPKEFAMVDKYVKLEDPNYSPGEKQIQRQEVIKQMTEK